MWIGNKRLAQAHQAIMTRQEFEQVLDKAHTEKLAKMLRILGILAQPKAYLFWKNGPALSFIEFLQQNQG